MISFYARAASYCTIQIGINISRAWAGLEIESILRIRWAHGIILCFQVSLTCFLIVEAPTLFLPTLYTWPTGWVSQLLSFVIISWEISLNNVYRLGHWWYFVRFNITINQLQLSGLIKRDMNWGPKSRQIWKTIEYNKFLVGWLAGCWVNIFVCLWGVV